jgi:hypothetical protein
VVVAYTVPVQKCDTIKTKVIGTAMQVNKLIGNNIKVIKKYDCSWTRAELQ